MPEPSTLAVFALASLILIAIPGPGVIYIVTRSLQQGRAAGLVSMLGIEAGALVHVAAAAVGLSALLASSATAFGFVKYAGAAYLVYLGVQALRRAEPAEAEIPPPASRTRLFRQGVLVQVLNPKVAVFFVAFLPQFVDPGHGSAAAQIAVLGVLFTLIAVLSDSGYAILAGGLGDRLRGSRRLRLRLNRASAVVYLGLGAVAAVTGQRPTRV